VTCTRTSIEIDDELLAEARRPSGAAGRRATVDTAPREPLARHRGPGILDLRGKGAPGG
jgi:Arc/MetJ family transcription regulator